MTDYKKLITRMADELDHYRQLLTDDRREVHALAMEARAALAEPEGVTDEELNEPLGDLIGKWCQEGMRVKPHGTSFPLAHYVASKAYQYGLRKGRLAPVLDGELGELVAWLRNMSEAGLGGLDELNAGRAADLLEQRQAGPVPVALSECPWEREGWCDDEGRCWAFNEGLGLPAWEFLSCTASREWADLFLPFNALPLPSGEVE